MPETVQRRVYFYRVIPDPLPDGTPQAFDAARACSLIGHLQFRNDFSQRCRYLSLGQHGLFGAWPKTQAGKLRLCFGSIRRNALPSLERLGNVTALALGVDTGLLELTHLVFFPGNIVGAEFNFYGPRISRLSDYLAEKCPSLPRVEFRPLLNKDTQTKLSRLEDVHLIRLRLHRSAADLLRQAGAHLPAALAAAGDQVNAPVVEVILRADPHSRRPLGHRALEWVKNLVGITEVLENADVFRVRGTDRVTGRCEAFDFLADAFVYTRSVAKEKSRSRAIDSADMFSVIEAAYNDNSESLADAAGVEL